MWRKLWVLSGGLFLSACAMSPYDSCMYQVRSAYNGDISGAEREIRDAEANLSRGYGLKKHKFTESYVDKCVANGVVYPCTKEREKTTEVPIPINREAETQRLERNKKLLERLQGSRERASTQCNGLSTST